MHGYQLNIPWPPVGELGKYRDEYPQLKIVLQIGEETLNAVNRSPQGLADKLAHEYAGLVDYILLDPSAGSGTPLNPQQASQYLKAVQEADPGIGLGVAGGLSPRTLDLVEPLVKDFPGLSIDAESLLRDRNDDLDVGLARAYIGKALELFSGCGE